MKKNILAVITMVSFISFSAAQITFNTCHYLLENQDYTFNLTSVDASGRNVYQTTLINGDQPCSGLGVCELQISWSSSNNRWEILADDGTGDFSNPYLLYFNTEASEPNPPDLTLGVWLENVAITLNNCEGDLTTSNATLTGDVQDKVLNTLLIDDNQVSFYPNPASQIVKIKSNVFNIQDVLVYNITGKKVLKTRFKNDNLDVSNLNSGFYIVKIKHENSETIKRLIIK